MLKPTLSKKTDGGRTKELIDKPTKAYIREFLSSNILEQSLKQSVHDTKCILSSTFSKISRVRCNRKCSENLTERIAKTTTQCNKS